MPYCRNCGAEVNENAFVCVKCGALINEKKKETLYNPDKNEWLIVLLLCFFLGCFGFHRFYVGKIGTGVAQLLTCGGCGIWAFIDFIMILCGKFTDANGNTIKN